MTDYDGEPDEHRHQREDRDAQERRLAERERDAKAMTLTEFLLARIAEDEEIARDATNDGHRWLVQEETIELWPDDLEPATGFMHFPRKAHAYHAATWDPDRVLGECAAKRRIVEQCEERRGSVMAYRSPRWKDAMNEQDKRERSKAEARHRVAEDMVRALASVYAAHPDYRQEWAL